MSVYVNELDIEIFFLIVHSTFLKLKVYFIFKFQAKDIFLFAVVILNR
jgi:hypothetical protein